MTVEEMQFWNDLVSQFLNFMQVVALAYLAIVAKRTEDATQEIRRQEHDEGGRQ